MNMYKIIFISSIIAVILAIPTLLIFFAVYSNTNSILFATILGFGVHFIIFAFSEKISKYLLKIFDSKFG